MGRIAAIRRGCNSIRQLSSSRFVEIARRRTRSYQIHENGLSSWDRAVRFMDRLPLVPTPVLAVMCGTQWYLASVESQERKESDEKLRERLEKRGVNREYFEAKVAEIKQNIESGSASEQERSDLKTYKECLQFIRGA